MSGTDPRTQPQAVASSNPLAAVTAPEGVFRPLICDLFGQQWVALGDPNTGQEINAIQVQSGVVPANNFALVTASGTFGRDPANNTWRVVDAGVLNADAQPNTRVPLLALAVQSTLNSAGSFDRVRSVSFNQALGGAGLTVGIAASAAQHYLSNAAGTSAPAMLSADTAADDIAASNSNWLRTIGVPYLFDGATFDRAGSASATNLAAQSGARAALSTAPGEWTLTHAPIANTQATATRAAGAAGVRHVLRSINATLVGVGAIAAPISVVVRDGATGVGPILWADQLFAPAAGTRDRVTLGGLNIVGSAATALTVEFIAAPGATNFEAVAATGYSSA